MKTFLCGILLAFALSWGFAFADADKATGGKAQAAELNKAYAEYQRLAAEEKWTESLPHMKRAYELGLELLGRKPEAVVLAFDYGTNLKKIGNYQEASAVLEFALMLGETVYGKDSADLIPILTNLGIAVFYTEKRESYKSHYDRAVKITEQVHGPESVETAKLLLQITDDILTRDGARQGAEYAQRAYEILKKQLGDQHKLTGFAAFLVGKQALMKKKYKMAKNFLGQTLNTFDNPDAPDSRVEIMTHGFLVEVNEQLGEREEATRHCLAIGRMTPEKDNQEYVPLFKALPEYPQLAAQQQREGYVILEFTVNKSGFVVNPVVVESSNSVFNQPSIEAAKKFRYAPKFIDGKPVDVAGVQNKIIYQMER